MKIKNCIGLMLLVLLSLCICSVLPAVLPEKEKVTGRGWLSDDMLKLFGRSFLTGFTTKAVTTLVLNHVPKEGMFTDDNGSSQILPLYNLGIRFGCSYAVPRAIDYVFEKDKIRDQNTFLYPYAQKLDNLPASRLFFNPIAPALIPGLKEVCLLKSCNTQNSTVALAGTILGGFAAQYLIKEKDRSSTSFGFTANIL